MGKGVGNVISGLLQRFSKKYTVLFALAVSLVMLLIGTLFSWDEKPVMGLDKLCADVLITCACLVIARIIGLQDELGFRKKGFAKGMLYGIPFLIIGVASVLVSNMGIDWSDLKFISVSNALIFTVNMLFVGVNEEVWMRSLILNIFLQKYEKNRKGIWKAILLSALVFGVIHLPNIFFMDPVTLAVQVINAASAGVLFAVIFIKSRNIWAGIVVHAFVDWSSLFVANCFTGGNSIISVAMTIPQAIIVVLLGSVPPLIISWIYLRKV